MKLWTACFLSPPGFSFFAGFRVQEGGSQGDREVTSATLALLLYDFQESGGCVGVLRSVGREAVVRVSRAVWDK